MGRYSSRTPLKEHLIQKLAGLLTPQELEILPARFQVLGDIMLLNLKPALIPRQEVIAQAILGLLPSIKTVYVHTGGIKGQFREPACMYYIAGERKSVVQHVENRVKFEIDIEKIMFAKGNINERKYLPKLVRPGEVIVDMFAGIGYFSLPIAVHAKPAKIFAIEINPKSFSHLQRNVALNHVEDIINPIQGDCKAIVPELAREGIVADRVLMGLLPAPKDSLPAAFTILQKGHPATLHYEGIAVNRDVDPLFEDVKQAGRAAGHVVTLGGHRLVKSYGPFKYHAVLDCVVN